jgi:hypothetical protein
LELYNRNWQKLHRTNLPTPAKLGEFSGMAISIFYLEARSPGGKFEKLEVKGLIG